MHKRSLAVGLLLFAAMASLAAGSPDTIANNRGWLGVSTDVISGPLLIALGIENGVVVTRVADSSPAARAGLQVGDVVMELDGERISDGTDLRRAVRNRPDRTVRLQLLRKGQKRPVTVMLSHRRAGDIALLSDLRFPVLDEFEPLVDLAGITGERFRHGFALQPGALDSLRQELRELREELRQLNEKLENELRNR